MADNEFVQVKLTEAGENAAATDGFLNIWLGDNNFCFFVKKTTQVLKEQEWEGQLKHYSNDAGEPLLELVTERKPRGPRAIPERPVCEICDGLGMRVVPEGGRQVAVPCECRIADEVNRRLEQARIPKRFKNCTLESYDLFPGANDSLFLAHISARKFAESYPLNDGSGLLLTGTIGTGKTHLAVGILRELVMNRGARGLFWDYGELLKDLRNSYNKHVPITEMDILKDVFETDILVLDEIGQQKWSEWEAETVSHILNMRYNDKLTTIVTTNYPNKPEASEDEISRLSAPQLAMRAQTLGDRIGERMRSRLHEMCVIVEVVGEDFRQRLKRASIA